MNDLLQNYTTNNNSVIIKTDVVETEVGYKDKDNMTFCQAYYYDTPLKDDPMCDMLQSKNNVMKCAKKGTRKNDEVPSVSHFLGVLNDKNDVKYNDLIVYLREAGKYTTKHSR